jgi:nucleoid-associated protein YgaU
MGNLEKLGILVIVILVVVVGVVAMTPKSTMGPSLYPEQQAAEAATPPETLEPVASDVKKDDVWPASNNGAPLPAAKPLPVGETTSADPKSPATPEVATTRTIKVQVGDTLPKIAKRELGNAANFKQIQDLNPGLVPSKLKPGMELKVPVVSASTAGSSVLPPANPAASTPTPETSGRVYVVKAGDTLSSIATHEMHSSKWADLAKANEDVLHGSTSLKVGMKLTIPGDSGASSAVASHDAAPPATSTAGATSSEHEYVVKNGDTLWGIAKSEMGGEASVKDLRAANQDVLKGSDTLKVGMKLKIPAKK